MLLNIEFQEHLRREGHTVLMGRSAVTFRHVPYGKERPVEACLTTMWRKSASSHSLTLNVIFLPMSNPIRGQYSMLNEYSDVVVKPLNSLQDHAVHLSLL